MLTMIRAVFLYGELYFQIGELDSESVLRLSLALSSNLNVHNSLSIFHSFFYIFWATMRRISSGIQCEGCLPTPPPPQSSKIVFGACIAYIFNRTVGCL